MISWFILVTPPPILHNVSDEILRSFVHDPIAAKKYLRYTNHTQPVERGIKDLTFVAQNHRVEDRDAVLKLIHANREKMKSFRTKEQYNVFEAGVSQSSVLDISIIDDEVEDISVEDEDEACVSDDGLNTDSESEMQ